MTPVAGADVGEGEAIYRDNCLACHGEFGDVKETAGIDFSSGNFWSKTNEAEVLEAINLGRGGMPGFSFSQEEMNSLLDYLHQLEVDNAFREVMVVLQVLGLGALLVFEFDLWLSGFGDFLFSGLVGASGLVGFLGVFNWSVYFYLSVFSVALALFYLVINRLDFFEGEDLFSVVSVFLKLSLVLSLAIGFFVLA